MPCWGTYNGCPQHDSFLEETRNMSILLLKKGKQMPYPELWIKFYFWVKVFDSHYHIYIATDKRGYPHHIFLISQRKHMLWYSLEAPQRGASNEYPQHMFSLRNKKDIDIFQMENAPYLLLCIYALSPYHTSPKKKKLYLLLMCIKYWWMSGKQCRPWSDAAFCIYTVFCLGLSVWDLRYIR